MISVSFPKEDPVRTRGMDHFLSTYGLSFRQDTEAQVHISYSQPESDPVFSILVEKGELSSVPKWVSFGRTELPVFQEVNTPFSFSNGALKVHFDIFNAIGSILSGFLEDVWPGLSESDKDRISKIPFVDIYEKFLFQSILKACSKSGIPLVHKPFWPEGKPFAVCLTHDVDEVKKTYQYLTRPIRHLLSRNFSEAANNLRSIRQKLGGIEPYWTFDTIMQIESELGVSSSFYFLNEHAKSSLLSPKSLMHSARRYEFDDPKISDIIRKLDSSGWDVGLHGSFNSFKDIALLSGEKVKLEQVLGKKVTSTRQHHLNLKFPQTWQFQEKLGFEYDASLGFKDRAGFRWGTCFPFLAEGSLLELPLSIMDTPLFSEANPWPVFSSFLDIVGQHSGLLTALFHSAVLNPTENPLWVFLYQKFITDAKERNAWVANGAEVARWWKTRNAISFDVSFNSPVLKIKGSPAQALVFYPPEGWKVAYCDGAFLKDDRLLLSKSTAFVKLERSND